jgi:hypothetical protein
MSNQVSQPDAGLDAAAQSPAIPDPMRSRESATIPFFVACCIFLILMECLCSYSIKNIRGSVDFRSFYAAGYMVRTAPSQLYDLAQQKQVQDAIVSPAEIPLPFFHPSYEALIYAPFSFLPYRAAYLAFAAFNVLLLVAVFFAARPLFSRRIPFIQPIPGFIFFFFVPVIVAIWQGQDSILFLLLCCLTWRQLQSGKDLSAGCILALALFRFQLTIPIAILFAIRRGWRFSAGFLTAGAAVVLLSIALVGRTGATALIHLLSASSLSADAGSVAQRAMAIHPLAMPNLFGLLYALGTRHLSPSLAFAITALVSLAAFLTCAYRIYREPQDTVAFGIAILCSVLISYHLYIHDASLLLLPFVLLSQPRYRFFLLAFYWLPLVLLLWAGSNALFLLAIPTLALLVYALRPAPAIHTPVATPLYT